jgi:lipopolysaccharide/colanic/teichoic acid biosynthesis glycosyltransferase
VNNTGIFDRDTLDKGHAGYGHTGGVIAVSSDQTHQCNKPVIQLNTRSSSNSVRPQKPAYDFFKRIFDFVTATFLLLILLPVFVVVSICVAATSRGPVLFKQIRLGRHGKHFFCYKFRSMVADAEARLQNSPELMAEFRANGFKTKKNDAQITKIGVFLRTSSLDELPQLVNVLRGDMSMIGPRPIVPDERAKYGLFADDLLTVVPGLSGMWQANGRSDTTYEERIKLDMTYIAERSLMLDLKLALKTVVSVIMRKGAC